MKKNRHHPQLKEEFATLTYKMQTGNPLYDELLRIISEKGYPEDFLNKTRFWYSSVTTKDFPEKFFYATPPIAEAEESKRILITSTKIDNRELLETIKGNESHYKKVINDMQDRIKKIYGGDIYTCAQDTVEDLAQNTGGVYNSKTEYVPCINVGYFWEQFFGTKDFLDEKISIPEAIIGTGYMRNHNAHGGETLDVTKRLAEIASSWHIPYIALPSWRP